MMMSPDSNPFDPSAPLDPLPGHVSRGRLERVLRRGEFAVTAELNPPDSADCANRSPKDPARADAPTTAMLRASNMGESLCFMISALELGVALVGVEEVAATVHQPVVPVEATVYGPVRCLAAQVPLSGQGGLVSGLLQ